VPDALEAEALQKLKRALPVGAPVEAQEFGRDQHVVENSAPVKQDVALKDEAQILGRAGKQPVGDADLAA